MAASDVVRVHRVRGSLGRRNGSAADHRGVPSPHRHRCEAVLASARRARFRNGARYAPRGMAIAREAAPVGSLAEARGGGLDRIDLVELYRLMLVTRGIEERGHMLYRQGKIPGSFYTGRGNEAAAVGVGFAMGLDDLGAPTQRDMGVHVARGTEPWRIFAQYMGRVDGPTAGRDGNVHMAELRLGLIAMVSHLPAMVPVATGCALAFRIRGEARVALGWSGDGATSRSDWHEALNFAGVRRLPVEIGRASCRERV